ncbi:MAG: helix-turn-helix domain-containing protein [Clostridia bacterium]|nr:helix-turn-helix domain-containing protein [Clostridia bacterium]
MKNIIPKRNERLTFRDTVVKGHIRSDRRSITDDYEPHWHDYFEIEILTEGELIHTLNGVPRELSAKSAYIVTPTDFHLVRPKTKAELWNISFSEDAISEKRFCSLMSVDRPSHFQLDGETATRVSTLAELISAEAEREDGGCSKELLECLLTVIFRSGDTQLPQNPSSDQLSGIKKAILYLELHFRESPSLNQVAEQAGFHPHYLSELFKKVTGQSYTERLNALRIGCAKTMLSSGFSVTESCYRSGFGSLSNFLLVFKKQTGVSPDEYKKRKL